MSKQPKLLSDQLLEDLVSNIKAMRAGTMKPQEMEATSNAIGKAIHLAREHREQQVAQKTQGITVNSLYRPVGELDI